jgi:hypothetical protein
LSRFCLFRERRVDQLVDSLISVELPDGVWDLKRSGKEEVRQAQGCRKKTSRRRAGEAEVPQA